MKKMIGLMAAVSAILAVAACGGTSPAVAVTCTASQSPNLVGAGPVSGEIVQSVTYVDPGNPGVTPLGNVKMRIVSPFPNNVTICGGNCLNGGTFSPDTKVETDANGILIFTVKLQGPGSVAGSLIEIADSQASSTCAVPFTIAP